MVYGKRVTKSPMQRSNLQLFGIVLAGRESDRLKPFIKRLRGDALPKQYVSFTGNRSMLEHTYARAESLIAPKRLFTVIDHDHLNHREVVRQLRKRPAGTVVVQPQNKDSAAELLLPLMHIHKHHPEAAVAVFPSDQFVWEETRLMRYILLAHVIVKRNPAKLVLLGVKTEYDASEQDYVLPAPHWNIDGWGTRDVKQFVDQPNAFRANELARRGALRNTMLMVFNSTTLLRYVQEAQPDIHRQLEQIRKAIGTASEHRVVREAYDQLEASSFSQSLLQPIARRRPGALAVLPMNGVIWSDWGTEARIDETQNLIDQARHPSIFRPRVQIRRRSRHRGVDTGNEKSAVTLQ
jgi:mannose-1-phosphate guanylyltransferase